MSQNFEYRRRCRSRSSNNHKQRNPIGNEPKNTMGHEPRNPMSNGPWKPKDYRHYGRTMFDTRASQSVPLQRGNINYNDASNYNPLFLAVHKGNLKAAHSLLKEETVQTELFGRSLIHVAAARGHEKIICLLCQRNADVKKGDKNGNTPLHLALNGNHSDVVNLLINENTVNLKNRLEETPLHVATRKNQLDPVKNLLENGAWSDEQDAKGRSPFHVAVKERNPKIEIVKLLLSHGASAKLSCHEGFTPLHHVVDSKNEELADLLMKHGASINVNNEKGISPLILAIEKNDTRMVEFLLQEGSCADFMITDSMTPLHFAAQSGNKEIAELLMNNGYNTINAINGELKTPLHFSAANGHLEVLKYLIGCGANIEAETINDETPLYLSIVNNHPEVLRCLIDSGAKMDNAERIGSETVLHLSAAKGRLQILKLLIEGGARVNAQTSKGETPLHLSVAAGHSEIVKELLDRGADLEIKTGKRDTALTLAVKSRKKDLVSLLLTKGADIERNYQSFVALPNLENPVLSFDWTPLHIAAKLGEEEILRLLLDNGVNVDLKSICDKRPIHLAAMWGHQKSVEVLLEAGADIDANTRYLETPLHFAAASGRSSIVKLLLNAGAEANWRTNRRYTPLHYTLDRQRHNDIMNQKRMKEKMSSSFELCDPSKNIVLPYMFDRYLKITELLLIKGASPFDVNLNSQTPVSLASKMRVSEEDLPNAPERDAKKNQFRPEILRCLLNYWDGKDLLKLRSVLNDAVNYKCPELMDTLLEYDVHKLCLVDDTFFCKVRSTDDRGSVITVADYVDNVEIVVKSLVERGFCLAMDIDIAKLLLAIIVKMRSTHESNDAPQSKEINFLETFKLHGWYMKCELEIMRMRGTKVHQQSDITFYDILTKPVAKLSSYVRNENLLRILESSSCAKFPTYAEQLRRKIEKGKERRDLIVSSENFFLGLIRRNHKIELPSLVIDKLFGYFGVPDLRKLSSLVEVKKFSKKPPYFHASRDGKRN